MMGASMIRSVQNVAVINHYMKEDMDLTYETIMELAYEAGWSQNEDGDWVDPDYGDHSSSDPLELLFQHNLPEELENKILDKLEGELGKKHPRCVREDVEPQYFRSLPFIPDRRMADGYTELETFFVDSSGFGSRSEPALVYDDFVSKAKTLIMQREGATYFAITEAGQFQLYISAYGREEAS